MKTRTLSPVGSLHPVLFFAGIYAVALLFSIFICSSLFYSCNASKTESVQKKETSVPQETLAQSSNTVIIGQ